MLPNVEVHEGVRLIGHVALPGGRAMQVQADRTYAYIGHLTPGQGTSLVDISDPRRPKFVGALPGFPGTVAAKVQRAGTRLYVNYEAREEEAERRGFGIFDLTAGVPRELAYVHVGGRGVHRMWCTDDRLYCSAVPEGFAGRILLIYDVADPAAVRLLGRWWITGLGPGEAPSAPPGQDWNLHHPVVSGTRAYLGCWDAGMKILDVSDPAAPVVLGELGGWAPKEGGATHTALPLPKRGLVLLTDEALEHDTDPHLKRMRVVDARDERSPRLLALFPEPPLALASRGGRFGPHNVHEPRPEAFRSETLALATYYGGGLRLYDLTDPEHPEEVGAFLPEPPRGQPSIQLNDLYVREDGLILVSDRGEGGLYLLELDPELMARHAEA